MSEPETWPCPERARLRIATIMDSANKEIAGVVQGVRASLDIPDVAVLDLERGVFVIPPEAQPELAPGRVAVPRNRAERRRAAKLVAPDPPTPGNGKADV